MAEQLARGIFAEFAPNQNPWQGPNGMEQNLRLIDDHLGLYTLEAPVVPGTPLPASPQDGDGQIFTDGTYAVFNAGVWKNYSTRKGVIVSLVDGLGCWVATGGEWVDITAGILLKLATSSGDELICFLQSGVGAIPRTVHEKLLEIAISVADFGAVGDGTDESAAIYKARDVARAAHRPLHFPVPPVGYYAGAGGFDFTGDGLVVFGDGMPEYASDWSRLVPGSGTIFFGTVDLRGNRNAIYNCGLDCGEWFRANLNGGVYAEGLRNTDSGDPDALTTYNRDFEFDKIRILLAPADGDNSESWGHCLLVERVIGVRHGYIECHGGYHGYVIKALQVIGGDVAVHGQLGSTYIIKSDSASSLAGDIYINSIRIGHPLYSPFTAGRGIFESAGKVTRNVRIGALIGRNCDTMINRTGDNQVVGVTIGHIDYSDGNIYLAVVKIDSGALDWKIGTHRIRDCSRGFETTGGTNVSIGSGSVSAAYADGYILQGDIYHGDLQPINCGGYGVKNNGCFNLDPSRITGTNCTAGVISGLSNFAGSVTLTSPFVAGSSGVTANLIGNKMILRGDISTGSTPGSNVVLNVAAPYRPSHLMRGAVAAFDADTSQWTALAYEFYPSGDFLVHDATGVGVGGVISLDGIAWLVNV